MFHRDFEDYFFRKKFIEILEVLELYRFNELVIQGAEVTQAIQYYQSHRHLTDTDDQAPDNSVTLIAGKPAWVRVYVRSTAILRNFVFPDLANVTGTVDIDRHVHGDLYQSVASLTPEPPGTVTAHHHLNVNYDTERSTLTDTLNFIIPAEAMCGNLRLKVHVEAPGGYEGDQTIYINATLQQTLRVRGIMVGYDGPDSLAAGAANLVLAAPTLADLQATSAWTLLTFPVQTAATYGNAGTITWDQPLTDAPTHPGGCTPNWVALNTAVQAQQVADGNDPDVLYYGLLAAGIPMGPVVGCNTGGTSTGTNGAQVTMAHELGHACGLAHAPCGVGGDPDYPAYEPHDPAGTPQASIGEYGLNIDTGAIMHPGVFRDFMSYCGPRWISLYHYNRLVNNEALDPTRVCTPLSWMIDEIEWDEVDFPRPPDGWPVIKRRMYMDDPQPVISIIGVMQDEARVQISSIMRLDTIAHIRRGRRTDLIVELVGNEDEVLSRVPVYRLPSHGFSDCGCAGDDKLSSYPYVFQAFLPDVAAGTRLRILRGDDALWQRTAPKHEPRIEGFRVGVERDLLLAEWRVGLASEDLECWLQWSGDEGATWRALTTGVRGEKAKLDISTLGLPAGVVWVRLLVGDGFHTSASEPIEVKIPPRPPIVTIMTPRNGQRLLSGGAMRLWGIVSTPDGEPLEVDEAAWYLNEEQIGSGLDARSVVPPPGEYDLVLIVEVGKERFQATIRFLSVSITRSESDSK